MGTPKSSNFDINAQMPLDSKVLMTNAQRLALTTIRKYKYMEVTESDTGDNLEDGEIDQSQPSPSDRSILANQILQLIGISDFLGRSGHGQAQPLNTGLEYVYLTNLLMPQNLDPVLVIPTPEQLEQGTQLLQATNGHESQNCSICQDSFTEGQAIRKFRVCQHEFHRNCIDVWFQRNVHCPVCRHDVRANVVN